MFSEHGSAPRNLDTAPVDAELEALRTEAFKVLRADHHIITSIAGRLSNPLQRDGLIEYVYDNVVEDIAKASKQWLLSFTASNNVNFRLSIYKNNTKDYYGSKLFRNNVLTEYGETWKDFLPSSHETPEDMLANKDHAVTLEAGLDEKISAIDDPSKRARAENFLHILRLFVQGKTQTEVGEIMGVTGSRIGQIYQFEKANFPDIFGSLPDTTRGLLKLLRYPLNYRPKQVETQERQVAAYEDLKLLLSQIQANELPEAFKDRLQKFETADIVGVIRYALGEVSADELGPKFYNNQGKAKKIVQIIRMALSDAIGKELPRNQL